MWSGDLEISTKKLERSIKDLRSRMNTTVDPFKQNACKDSLEGDLNTFQAEHESVTDLFIRLELWEREQEIHDKFLGMNNVAFECSAYIRIRIKKQEMERVQLIL